MAANMRHPIIVYQRQAAAVSRTLEPVVARAEEMGILCTESEDVDLNHTRAAYDVRRTATEADWQAVVDVRMRVFVGEQGSPEEEEIDAYDATAAHYCAVRRTGECGGAEPERVVATARLVDWGEGTGKIGRLAVLPEHRAAGVGTLLMATLEEEARRRRMTLLLLDAQCYAIPFYEKLGYAADGPVFLDGGIDHRRMRKALE